MDAFSLVAKLSLDSSQYENGLDKAKSKTSMFGDVFKANIASDLVRKGFNGIVTGAKKAAGGIVNLTKQAVSGYSDYEQMTGGIKKLYGAAGMSLEQYAQSVGKSTSAVKGKYDSLIKGQNLVMENAKNAFKTSGMSANEYMDMATQFSASLISSLHGNTVEAAKQTDVAMKAISDNVNTFGSDMESVSYAFKGFSKQNYTMLDNLKLGYGGTKKEMQRLIKDANEYGKSQGKITKGNELQIESFSDVVTAIELIQEKQQIAGTTAREGASTVEGSMKSVKAAWNNLVNDLANPDADFKTDIDNLVTTAEAAFKNMMPVVERALNGVAKLFDKLAPVIADKLPKIISDTLPKILKGITAIINSIAENLPTIMKAIMPAVVESLTTIITTVCNVLPKMLPAIIPPLVKGLAQITAALIKNLPAFISSLMSSLLATGKDLGAALPPVIFFAFKAAMGSQPFGKVFSTIFGGLGKASGVISKVMPVFSKLGGGLKNLLPAVGKVGSAFKILWGVLTGNPIGLIITLIGGVILVLVTLYKKNEKFRNFVNGMFKGIADGAKALASTIGSLFTEKIPGFFKSLGEHFKGLGSNAKQSLGSAGEHAKKFASSVSSSFNNKIPIAINNLKKAFSNLGSRSSSIFKGIGKAASSMGSGIRSIFTSKIPNAAASARKAFSNLRSNAGKSLSGLASRARSAGRNVANVFTKTLPNAGKSFIKFLGGLPSKAASAMGSLRKHMASVGSRAMKALRNAFNGVTSIGKNIVQGIWKGISGAFGWLKDKIGGFGKKVVGWFKDTFKIGSPSKVMRDQVGKYVAQGMVQGWEREGKKAKESAERLAGTAVKGAQDVVLGSAPDFSSMIDRIYSDVESPKQHTTATQRAQQQRDKRASQSRRRARPQQKKRPNLPSDEELEQMRQELQDEDSGDPKARWRRRQERKKRQREEEKEEKRQGNKGRKSSSSGGSKKDDDKKPSKRENKGSSDNGSKGSSNKGMTEDEFNAKLIQNAEKRVKALKKANMMTEEQEAAFWVSLSKKVDKGSTAYAQIMAKAAEAQNAQRKKSFKAAEDALAMHELKAGKKSAKYEAEYWNNVRKQYQVGTAERAKADKKYYTARNKIQAEALKNTKQYWSTYKIYHKTTLSDEVAFYNEARKQFKKGTKERIAMDKLYFSKRDALLKKQESAEKKYLKTVESAEKKYRQSKASAEKKYQKDKEAAEKKYRSDKKEAEQALNEALKEAEETYQDALAKTQEKLADRKKALLDNFSLFEKFDTGDMVGKDDLTNNLQSQVGALEDWIDEIEVLRSKIGGTDLFDVIQEMGVSGLQQVRALNTMSSDELKRYTDLYKKRQDLADQESHTELDQTIADENAKAFQEYTDNIAKANETYEKAMEKAQKTLDDSLKKAADTYQKSMEKADKTYKNSVTKAYNTFKSSMESVGLSVSNASKKVKKTIKNANKVYSSELDGMASKTDSSMNSITSKVASSFNKMSKSSKRHAKDMVQNFINGLKSQSSALGKAVDELIKKEIYSKLHFSEPDDGPLKNFHTYAPDMIDLFTKGINDNGHKIGEALDKNIQLKDISGRVQDAMTPRLPQTGQLNIPGLPSLTPVSTQTQNNQRPVDLHITMNVDRTAFARIIYRLNKEENQRVGLNLATGAGI